MNAAILEQLSKLESVPENWESGGASPPNSTARVNARRVIELFLLAGCVPDNVDPSEGEGVHISLRCDDRYASIECFNDGIISALVSRDDTVDVSQLWEVKPGEMINAVQKIKQFFATDQEGVTRIVSDPKICGGDPRIAGTRIPVWGLEIARKNGLSDSEVIEMHPFLSQEDVLAAWAYADENRDEIESQIRENEDVQETDEILADTDFADALRESMKQADAGNTRPLEEIKDEMGL